jgi:ribose-phosphate pyrophosphokinase
MEPFLHLVSPNFSDLFTPNVEVGKFPDGDSHVRIPSLSACRGQNVVIYHRLYPNQNDCLIELLLMLDAVKHEEAKSITVVSPYLPYARQDKQTVNGEIASSHVICNLLASSGCGKLVTFDAHFLNEEGEVKYGDLNILNVCLSKELIAHAKQSLGGQPFEVIGPDAGAAYLVKTAGGKNLKKVRKAYADNKIAYRHIETMEGDFDVRDKNILLLDDMISTGSTMIKALEKMKEPGAKRVICAATHGLFLYNCLDLMRKHTDIIFASDSILTPQSAVSIRGKLEDLFNGGNKLF